MCWWEPSNAGVSSAGLQVVVTPGSKCPTSTNQCCVPLYSYLGKKRPPTRKSAMEQSSKLEFLSRNSAKICIVRVRGHIHRCHHSNYFLPLLPFSALKSSFSHSFSWPVLSRSPWEFVLGVDSSCLFFKWRQTISSAAVSAVHVFQSKFTGALLGWES